MVVSIHHRGCVRRHERRPLLFGISPAGLRTDCKLQYSKQNSSQSSRVKSWRSSPRIGCATLPCLLVQHSSSRDQCHRILEQASRCALFQYCSLSTIDTILAIPQACPRHGHRNIDSHLAAVWLCPRFSADTASIDSGRAVWCTG